MTSEQPTTYYPNRDKPESIKTRSIVVLILLVSAALVTIIAVAGWSIADGGQLIEICTIAAYVGLAFLVTRWNRGSLAVAAAVALLVCMLAIAAGPGWFSRGKSGFEQPLLPANLLGILTLLVIPAQILLIVFSLRGFKQEWNIEQTARSSIKSLSQ